MSFLAWAYKGSALFDLGREEEAIQQYDKAMEIELNNAGI